MTWAEPKLCPFCGSKPVHDIFGYYHIGSESQEVRCKNEKCKVKPYIIQEQSEYGDFSIIEEWNTRHEGEKK